MDVQGEAALPGFPAHQHASAKPVWASLEEAARMKTEGNAFYKDKNIRSAIGRYHRALLVLRGLDPDVMVSVKGLGPEMPALSPEQEASLRSTQGDCYNNLAGKRRHGNAGVVKHWNKYSVTYLCDLYVSFSLLAAEAEC